MNGRHALGLAIAALVLAVLAAEWAVFRAVAPQWPVLIAHDRGAAAINAGVVVAREGFESLGLAGRSVARASARTVLPAVHEALARSTREASGAGEATVAREARGSAPGDACRAVARAPVRRVGCGTTC